MMMAIVVVVMRMICDLTWSWTRVKIFGVDDGDDIDDDDVFSLNLWPQQTTTKIGQLRSPRERVKTLERQRPTVVKTEHVAAAAQRATLATRGEFSVKFFRRDSVEQKA